MYIIFFMYYAQSQIISSPIGNNAFVYNERKELFGKAEIVVPQLIEGTVDDVQLGDCVVFSEELDGKVREFRGLSDLVCIRNTWEPRLPRRPSGTPHPKGTSSLSLTARNDEVVICVMDNHNHALYCWYRELLAGRIDKWLPLIHIDQHSDMNNPVGWIESEKEDDLDYIAEYVNEVCTIADFIQPALQTWLISQCLQVRTEYSLLAESRKPKAEGVGYILDIDIDFWAPEMGIEEFDRTIEKTRQLIAGASLVTIATSPCFIEQERAVEIVSMILG